MKVNLQIKSLRKQAGYTLIELSIAIAIISVLIMTALFGVQKILENNQVNAASQQVTLAVANINKYGVMLSDKAFVAKTSDTVSLGVWPDNLLTKVGGVTSKVNNPFGGEYLTGITANGYYIVITGVPLSACVATAASFGNTASAISTDESAVTYATPTPAPKTSIKTVKVLDTKIVQADLTAACAAVVAGTTKKNLWITYAL